MAEMRKKLTGVQMQQLSETQTALIQAKNLMEKVQGDAQRVIALIFDAHGVPMHYTADIDRETGELVCKGEDEAPLASKLEK